MNNRKKLHCLAAVLCLAAGILFTRLFAYTGRASDYETKLAAAATLQEWMNKVRDYKQEAGLPIIGEDLHQTGMLGEEYTFITTTHGAVDAKRTTANPDMAALLVQMLTEAGVKPGDTIGAGFSGSFPAMNLAVLAACDALEIHCIYIASIGASTFGANQPELTFPDMVWRLYQDGLLKEEPALFTPGGHDDCGTDMDPDLLAEILQRLDTYGIPILQEPDFEKNIGFRRNLYEENGPIRCFVGVGGNLTTTGAAETDVPFGLIPPGKIRSVSADSGLVQRYNAEGLPVLHLLNIRKLMTDYGMTYDPEELLPPGESILYEELKFSRVPALLGLLGAFFFLITSKMNQNKKS